jgi:hypothetical protein
MSSEREPPRALGPHSVGCAAPSPRYRPAPRPLHFDKRPNCKSPGNIERLRADTRFFKTGHLRTFPDAPTENNPARPSGFNPPDPPRPTLLTALRARPNQSAPARVSKRP